MAQKTKRKASTSTQQQAAQVSGSTLTRRFTSSEDFNPDYTHVKIGLKRIGVISGSFIVILVVLSFFLK